MKRRKIKTAGPMVAVCDYPQPAPRESAQLRAEKRKLSSEAQQRMNVKYSWQNLMWKLAANFVPGDLVVTLTYDDEHLPKDAKQAQRCMKEFRTRMSKSMKARGKSFVAIYSTEHLHSSRWVPEDGRWHHHVVLRAQTGDEFRMILSAWPYGSDIEIHRFEVNGKRNYETLARYMSKERASTSRAHVWNCTHNCRKPESESFIVPEDTRIEIPDNAMFVQHEMKETVYGRFEFACWFGTDPKTLRALRPKARRKR